MKNFLNDMFDVVDRQAGMRETRIQEYNLCLREPDKVLFVPVDGYRYTYGYWRIEGGIVKARKYKNGYHPYDYSIITDDECKTLASISFKTPKELLEVEDEQA